jgi:ribonuclease PH
MRHDHRSESDIREIKLSLDYLQNVPASVFIEQGLTRIVSSASIENRVPHFLKDSGKGWINAEYGMLPGSVGIPRLRRERSYSHNRHIEIQRFLGRALRSTFDLKAIEGKTILIDADVIQADGSTRCAALNAGMVLTVKILRHLVYENLIPDLPEIEFISAVSVGILDGNILVDLNYQEDSTVEADINVVSSEKKNIIEVQSFAENKPVSHRLFKKAMDIAVEKNLEIIGLLKKHL